MLKSFTPESVSTSAKLVQRFQPSRFGRYRSVSGYISGLPFSLNVLPIFLNPSFHCLKSLFGMILLANILNTLIQLDNSKHRSGAIGRLSEGRKIHILSCNIEYPVPVSQCSRSPRNTWSSRFLSARQIAQNQKL